MSCPFSDSSSEVKSLGISTRRLTQNTGVVLSALVVIPSADLNAEAESTSPCVSFDGQAISPQPDSLQEWISVCGIRYLEEVKYGRYFFLSARAADLEATFKNEAEQGWADIVSFLQVEE